MTRKNIEGSPIRPFKIMNKTVTEIAKEFTSNYRYIDWKQTPREYHPSDNDPLWERQNKHFYFRDSWREIENSGESHLKSPFNLWANAHTLSVQDEVITITRDEDNDEKQFTYGVDSFNTICVKNLDEGRKLENNNALFGGLYVVDYSTKKLYRLVTKINNKVRLERILNGYVTKLPWLVGKTARTDIRQLSEAFDGTLDTTNFRPSENGY